MMGGTKCVLDSALTVSHICTYFVPINCTIIAYVQQTFHFDIDLIADTGQGHKPLFYAYLLYELLHQFPHEYNRLCATYLLF